MCSQTAPADPSVLAPLELCREEDIAVQVLFYFLEFDEDDQAFDFRHDLDLVHWASRTLALRHTPPYRNINVSAEKYTKAVKALAPAKTRPQEGITVLCGALRQEAGLEPKEIGTLLHDLGLDYKGPCPDADASRVKERTYRERDRLRSAEAILARRKPQPGSQPRSKQTISPSRSERDVRTHRSRKKNA